MGESTVDPPKSEAKMGSVGEPTLEVSVSFGRFENDSLSWDRWSSFSQNKYLEEVEKCSKPGSVAMKKAYFEAHYKKIAAKKAALMDQQAEMEHDIVKSDAPNGNFESEVYISKDQCFTEETMDKALNGKVESEIYASNEQCFTEEIMDKALNGKVESEIYTSNEQCFTEEIMDETINGNAKSEIYMSNEQFLTEENNLKTIDGDLESEVHTSNGQCPVQELMENVKTIDGDLDSEVHTSNVQCIVKELMEHVKTIDGDLESEVHTSNGHCFIKELMEKISSIGVKNSTSVTTSATDSESSSVEKGRELDSGPYTPCSIKPEDYILLKETTPSVSIQDHTEALQEPGEEKKQAPKIEKGIMKKDLSTKPKKTTKVIKERNIARVPKKAVSPLAKLPQVAATPRVLTPSLTPSTPSMARSALSLTKKGTNPSQLKSSNFSSGEKRRVVPSSLHMSYSSDPRKLDLTTPGTIRKSMIMEKMGDKDIVKRAFRSFQSSVNQLKSSTEEISSLPNQMQRKVTELKVSSLTTPRKDESRSYKAGAANGKSATTVSSSTTFRSNATTDTRKKLVKKLDEKSSTKEADKTRVQSKVKDQKEAEMKKIRQSLNFKATPLPNFYKGQQISKILSNKDGSNNDTIR